MGIASVAYLVMATGNGSLYVLGHDAKYRQFLFARYIDWVFTTPLQLLDLAGLAGASNDVTLWLLCTDALMIASGLIGALLTDNNLKWAFWGYGMLFFMPIVYFLVYDLPASAEATGGAAASIVKKVAMLTVITWSAYPIVWIVGEGASLISADAEAIAYCALDVTAKSVFGWFIINAREGIDQALAASDSMGQQLLDEKAVQKASGAGTV